MIVNFKIGAGYAGRKLTISWWLLVAGAYDFQQKIYEFS